MPHTVPSTSTATLSAAVAHLAMVDTLEAAETIGMSASWLDKDRLKKTPEIPFVRIGSRAVRYRVTDLAAYLERQVGKPLAA